MIHFNKKKTKLDSEFTPYLDLMDDCNIKKYISNRVIKQINWYDQKSIHFQTQFKWMSTISIILSASIPILTTFNLQTNLNIKIIIAVLSSFVTIITSILSLCKSRELWIEYRTCCETLKSLLYKFFNNCDSFNCENDIIKNNLLILSCETIFNSEVHKWNCSNNEQILKSYGVSIDS